MFHACCHLYGTRPWSLAHTVLLYGVLHGLMQGTPLADMHRRLRILRNLIEASRSEIRADSTRNNMPALLVEVETIMAGGPPNAVQTFNQVQVRNEQAKQALVEPTPTLHEAVCQLEDHELLRGGLTVFDLSPAQDPRTFASRARQFSELVQAPLPPGQRRPSGQGPCRQEPPAQFGPSPGLPWSATADVAVGKPLAHPLQRSHPPQRRRPAGPAGRPGSRTNTASRHRYVRASPFHTRKTGATTSPNTGPCAV